ncbi:MAG: NAD(+) diphosphatase [Bacteroidales bacterium]|nr:NAD(+) diphosphatase [Bacteroidales bacterium]
MFYFAFNNRDIILRRNGEALTADDMAALSIACGSTETYEESITGIRCLGLKNAELLPDGYMLHPLRFYFSEHTEEEVLRASRAKALLEWRSQTRYCPRCGAKLTDHETLTARLCPDCQNLIFPRIEPCVIMLIHRDGKILLARNVNNKNGMYACLAGFMEAGETAEQAVRREVFEEIHLHIRNLKYFGSQSWPFPAQLMIAFTAEYESGELQLQTEEIADAAWFDPLHLPAVTPPNGSIAHRLIQAAVDAASSSSSN